MEEVLGYLKISVKRGINLARRDLFSSDPYAVVKMGQQSLKTRTILQNRYPEWNQDLLLSVTDPNTPVFLKVYDKDAFTGDDEMGEAVVDIKPFLEAVRTAPPEPPVGSHVMSLPPNPHNCLSKPSVIMVSGSGKITQEMKVRLRNVESGEVELKLEWVNAGGCKGFCRGRFASGFHTAARSSQLLSLHSKDGYA
ncbi:PREDICTED: protein C2-DOMAIN ABA-RELATED 7 [Tarenaya hassleriana]|uniref:protein C2-DOMAIN ABA-RELATED 7 n=1 Tax=Tarenaya hassleriana TaxID=28532 RepID=UPI00053C9102|nr:PREDICTED: protein C2-DOMAIN ABA-RELATED 7 [Tarenaya hassleriana]